MKRENSVILIVLLVVLNLLSNGCDFKEQNKVRFHFMGNEINERVVRIALSSAGDEYHVYIVSKGRGIVVGWSVKTKDPLKWNGQRYYTHRFRVDGRLLPDGKSYSAEGRDAAVIVEITDVEGMTVSGKISGSVRVGSESIRIGDGSFRGHVEYWDR